jgi:hypothetical protein
MSGLGIPKCKASLLRQLVVDELECFGSHAFENVSSDVMTI